MIFLGRSIRTPFRSFSSQKFQEIPRRNKITGKIFALGALSSFSYYMYMNYQDAKEKETRYDLPAYKLSLYRLLPVNAMTRVAGRLAEVKVSEPLRKPIYGLYSLLFGCKMEEAAESDFSQYETFNQFFTRSLKKEVRPFANTEFISPADGKVMALGKLSFPFPKSEGTKGDALLFPEQIKGISYPLKDFLTEKLFNRFAESKQDIFYCTIYLSPGDYHRFHSPAYWTQTDEHTVVSGEVLSVAPFMMRWVKNLFCLNERVILSGTWKQGNLAMIPVGATNVSSIKLVEKSTKAKNAKYAPGEHIGTFELGSTVVLLFNGPKDFEWTVEVGEKIKMGEALGDIPKKYYLINGIF